MQYRNIMLSTLMCGFALNATANKACKDDSFKKFYQKVRHNKNAAIKYLRLNKTPDNYSAFKVHCYANTTNGTCFDYFGKRYRIIATSGKTKKWSGAVCGRMRQADNFYNYEHRIFLEGRSPFFAYPHISFQYKGDDGKWRIMKDTGDGDLASFYVKETGNWQYRWWASYNKARQYRIVVQRSMKFDEFDLAMDW